MEKAKEILKDPRIKVYEATDAVGYTDNKYFVRIFKESWDIPLKNTEKDAVSRR